LFAQWTANSLTVPTDEQGGSAIADATTTTGASMASPGTPTRAGYAFAGWFAASSGGSAITFSYTHGQTANFTLFAQWTANTLTVTYDSQSGSAIGNGSTTTGGQIASSPGTPTRAGYAFAGWFVASSGGSAVSFPYTHGQTANFTLFAQWTAPCAEGGTCVVGDTGPGGGKVFYVAGSNFTSTGSDCNTACRYLEVAPDAGEVARSWATDVNNNRATTVSGADATAIGSGYQNSVDIQNRSGNVAASAAAVYALGYTNNSTSDWHLPSKVELNELCKYARTQSTGNTSVACANSGSLRTGFSSGAYWSSSEYSSTAAWAYHFVWYEESADKSTSNRVRPVRAFGLPPFSVTYNGNTHGSGSVPTDSSTYAFNASVTVASNSGSLAKSGYTFDGWCTTQPAAGSACGGTSRAAGSTFSITSNVTLYAVWTVATCASGGTCVVGDTGPGGGIVFYVHSSGTFACGPTRNLTCTYLEAAPENWNGDGGDPQKAWSGNTSSTVGGTSREIGYGYQNTIAAVAQGSGGNTADRAVTLADSYANNGKSDWYLPSRDELNELCKYARTQTTGNTAVSCASTGTLRSGFGSSSYWSSSEFDGTRAFSRSFSSGSADDYPKTNTYRVRPIRAF